MLLTKSIIRYVLIYCCVCFQYVVYGQRIVGYYPSYRDGMQNQIEFNKMTDVFFSFLNFNPATGALDLSNVAALNNLITAAKNSNPSIRIHLSTGGGNFGTTGFNMLTGNMAAMNAFVTNMTNYIETRNLDGWNLDWEYPHSTAEINNHEILVKAMQTALSAKQLSMCKKLDLSLAVDGVSSGVNLNFTTVGYVDYIIVMSYDAPAFINANHSSYAMAEAALDGWNTWGVPYNKMMLAVPFYGRNLARDDAWTYSQIAVPDPATAYNSPTNLYNNFYYNATPLLRNKVDLSMRNGKETLGVAIWEIGQDRAGQTYSLLDAIHDKFMSGYGLTTTFPDPCSLPVDFVNIKLKKLNEVINIQWLTANEESIKEYIIYRSTDGFNFSKVGEVQSFLNSFGNTYHFNDDVESELSETFYYKIGAYSSDGSKKYTSIFSVNNCNEKPITKITSIDGRLELIKLYCLKENEDFQMIISDISGRVYRIEHFINGTNSISLSHDLHPGVYLIQLLFSDRMEKQRIIIP